MKKALIFIMHLMLFSLLVGCQATSETNASREFVGKKTQVISGTISYREKMALPDNAVVTISLEDTSLVGAPSAVIAIQEFITEGKQVPLGFVLNFDNNKIRHNHRYNLHASIHINGQLRFTTPTTGLVMTDIENTQQVNLYLVGLR